MNVMTQLYLTGLLSFGIPIVIYLICSKILKKPLLNLPIFIVLLLALMIWQVFGYEIRSVIEINFAEDMHGFFHGDGVIIVWVQWLPAVAGAFVTNVFGFAKQKKNKSAGVIEKQKE